MNTNNHRMLPPNAPVRTPSLARPYNAAPCCTSCTGNTSPSSCPPFCLARRACRSDPETAQRRLDIGPGAIGLRPRLRPSQTSRCAGGRLRDGGRTVGRVRPTSVPVRLFTVVPRWRCVNVGRPVSVYAVRVYATCWGKLNLSTEFIQNSRSLQ